MDMATRGRIVQANQVVLAQADFFEPDGFTRVAWLGPGSIEAQLFSNNTALAWTLVSGVAVTDAQVNAGQIYFSEIAGVLGFYSVRFRPDGLGYWRLVLSYPTGRQTCVLEFDVVQSAPAMETGLRASFIKSGGNCGC